MSSSPHGRVNSNVMRQQGYAVLLAMMAIVMATLTFLVGAANQGGTFADRDAVTRKALAEAKEALIGFAATASRGPGHFICPDHDNDGDSGGVVCPSNIGRIPWKTLEIADLRDANGERLWYAVSDNFLNLPGRPVNSDTKGQFTVNGMAANEIVAIIFSPGPALSGKSRNTAAELLDISNYLEGQNADGTINQFETALPSTAFNDQLLVIRAGDVFPIAEAVAARKIALDLGVLLNEYRKEWKAVDGKGFFPHPSPFANPTQVADNYCGDASTSQGLLPVSIASTCVNFTSSAQVVNGASFVAGTSISALPACTRASAAGLVMAIQCAFDYNSDGFAGTPQFHLQASFTGLAQSLALPINQADITPGTTLFSQNFSGGHLAIDYKYDLPPTPAFGSNTTVTVTIPVHWAPQRLKDTGKVDALWFFQNEWYRNTLYAITPDVGVGGPGVCGPGTCLSVVKSSETETNKSAVLVLAGMTLSTKTRPSSVMADYFEGSNLDGDLTYEFLRRSFVFNDKVAGIEVSSP